MNTIVLSVSAITGLLAEYLVGQNENFVRKLSKVGQIGINSIVFGIITPQEYSLIAVAYIAIPTIIRLMDFKLTPIVEDRVAQLMGKFYLRGEEVNVINIAKYFMQEHFSGKRKRGERDGISHEGAPDRNI